MDIYAEPANPSKDALANLGPLAALAGTWEGDEGVDTSPKRPGPEVTKFRERMTFEPFGPVLNGPQALYGLKYSTLAWPLGEDEAFHDELGYWLWDPAAQQVSRWFLVPRGMAIGAGGSAAPDATEFTMRSELGAEVYGLSSNPFLDQHFKTVRYEVTVKIHADGRLSYEEDTVLKISGSDELFHHTDRNTLVKVSD